MGSISVHTIDVVKRIAAVSAVALLVGTVMACASAGEGDDQPMPDAQTSTTIDAPVQPTADANKSMPDARVFNTVDAANTQPPDANTAGGPDAGGGLICNGPADCPLSTECCFSIVPGNPGFCVPGTETLGVCFPD